MSKTADPPENTPPQSPDAAGKKTDPDTAVKVSEFVSDFMLDAELVEDYATNCGLLKDDTFLIALETARKLQTTGELDVSSEAYRDLRSKYNSVIRTIYPVSIVDLRKSNPVRRKRYERSVAGLWDRLGMWGKRVANGIIALLAILIFLLTAHYTVWSQHAELRLHEARALEERDRVELEREYLTWLIGRIAQSDEGDGAQLAAFWGDGASHLDEILSVEKQVLALALSIEKSVSSKDPLEELLERLGRYVCYMPVPASVSVAQGDTNGMAATGQSALALTGAGEGAVRQGELIVREPRRGWYEVICNPDAQPRLTAQGNYYAIPSARSDTPPKTDSGAQDQTGGATTGAQPTGAAQGSEPPPLAGTAETALPTSAAAIAPRNSMPARGWGLPWTQDPEMCEERVIATLKQIEDMIKNVPPSGTSRTYPEIHFDVGLRDQLIKDIRCARDFAHSRNMPQPSATRAFLREQATDLEQRFIVVSAWWLPSLYGALGAMVYTLGFMLSRIHPDPKFFRSIVRLMMGSLAGVTVVNFFTPEIATMVYLPVKSFGLLAIAFLAGFSVEVVLELLRNLVNRWSERVSSSGSSNG